MKITQQRFPHSNNGLVHYIIMGHLFQNQPHSCIYLSFIGVEKQLRAIRALPIQVPFGRFVVGKDSVKQKPAVLHCRRDSVSYTAENINVYNKRKSGKEGSMWAYKVMRWSWCSHQLSAPRVLQHLMLFNSFIIMKLQGLSETEQFLWAPWTSLNSSTVLLLLLSWRKFLCCF